MKQIIAMGGGGFSMEPDNLLLDQYLLEQSVRSEPKVCFLPTASGDAENYIRRFYQAFQTLQCKPSHLSLFKPPSSHIRSFLMDKDIIYVGGGNTRNMLVLWKEWGLDRILREAWKNGIILAGLSAGAICWFEEGVTDSIGELTALKALGFLPGSFCPHYDGEKNRRPAYHRLISEKRLQGGYAADDGAALHYIGDQLFRAVSSRADAGVYRVYGTGESVEETELNILKLSEC
ncbi:Type 1 glutamine amidotransferase-like domain-containing protein [Bacillus sp. YC2]|uniref:Type 1 glutamine amidotransferase-like domain-containing protein n=1 Tax=Bacillus sp. YC2 TaxID=2861287 RepID=UPI001CA71B38|nr:Type 1 glutamine amidotransferase-like domain-containing protein [Bacillus sp. YC2]MBY8912737.1 Type 1 glutamine amidotransferase-like domain-containing protein [Bacillus sp. YC2]